MRLISVPEENRPVKIAIIKQDVYSDLYVARPGDKEFYRKSPRRSGPLSLPHLFECDFYIVKLDKSEECNLWKSKVKEAGHGSAESWMRVPDEYNYNGMSNSDCAVLCDEIPYEEYDIVVSFDIAVPSRIVNRCKDPLWCYFISEPPLTAYKESWKKPLFGYDIFLTQRFRAQHELTSDASCCPQSHTIDFPYVSASSATYRDLFGFQKELNQGNTRPTVAMPRYSWESLSPKLRDQLSSIYELTIPSGTIEGYLKALYSSDFFLRLGNKPKFGNETIEAVASGAVFISSTRGWKNRVFNIPGTALNSLDQDEQTISAIKAIDRLWGNKTQYELTKNLQQRILDYLCYYSPIEKLLEAKLRKTLRQSSL